MTFDLAHRLAIALGRHWSGHNFTAPCPVCQPERRPDQNALSVSLKDGKLLLHCHRSGCAYHDIMRATGIEVGAYEMPDPATMAKYRAKKEAENKRRADLAERCWKDALPISGSLAETYLRNRGITADLPPALRFHFQCWHGPSAKRLPAMVALIEGSSSFAVHRTFLASDGSAKATVVPAKLMLGSCSGGHVEVAYAKDGPLVVAEGIETALSIASGLLNEPATIWAALSTSGMMALKLPSEPRRIIVASDGDDAGRAASRKLAERAYRDGWDVALAPAKDGFDFNDYLRAA